MNALAVKNDMKLSKCWYVEVVANGFVHIVGVFLSEKEAETCIEHSAYNGFERYVREGLFATSDGACGVLADSPIRTIGKRYPIQ